MRKIEVVDSHTEGEPTRVVVAGGPDLGCGDMAARLAVFRAKHEAFRSAVANEPRGNDAMVGALLCAPVNPEAAAGVIFFNNVGYLGMCGHGTIGLVATLAYLCRIGTGTHLIETPAGTVAATLGADGLVSIENVPSYRHLKGVSLEVPGVGRVSGDVAWGGNWFFLCEDHGMKVEAGNIEELTRAAWAIRLELTRKGIMGANGAEIDHVELFGPSGREDCKSRNFVLCPGKAYDRSPCGTGTSAKLACLHADGKLLPGEEWGQESIIGSAFRGKYRLENGRVIPTISGRAYITARGELLLDPRDPLRHGIRLA